MDLDIRNMARKIGVSHYKLSSFFKGVSNMKSDELSTTLKELEENRDMLEAHAERARLEIDLLKQKEALS